VTLARTVALTSLSAAPSPPVPRAANAAEGVRDRMGVLLRCTGEEDPPKARAIVKSRGIERIQGSRLPDRFYTPEGAREFAGLLKATGIRPEAVVVVFDGESYADQEARARDFIEKSLAPR
jgi:hypothetical protein